MTSRSSISYSERRRAWIIEKKREKAHEERLKAHIAKYERERMKEQNRKKREYSRQTSRSRSRRSSRSRSQERNHRSEPGSPAEQDSSQVLVTLNYHEIERIEKTLAALKEAKRQPLHEDTTLPTRGGKQPSRTTEGESSKNERRQSRDRRSPLPSTSGTQQDARERHRSQEYRRRESRHPDSRRRYASPTGDDGRRESTHHNYSHVRKRQLSPYTGHSHNKEREHQHRHDRSRSRERDRCPICNSSNRNCLCCFRCHRRRNSCICNLSFCHICSKRHSGPCPRPEGHPRHNSPVDHQSDRRSRSDRPHEVRPPIGNIPPDYSYDIHSSGPIPYQPVAGYYEPRLGFIPPPQRFWPQGQMPRHPAPQFRAPHFPQGFRPYRPRRF